MAFEAADQDGGDESLPAFLASDDDEDEAAEPDEERENMLAAE